MLDDAPQTLHSDADFRAERKIPERCVTAVQLHEFTADLVIDFTDDLRLEVIPTSSGYEAWQLRDPWGTSFIAVGGGEVRRWKP